MSTWTHRSSWRRVKKIRPETRVVKHFADVGRGTDKLRTQQCQQQFIPQTKTANVSPPNTNGRQHPPCSDAVRHGIWQVKLPPSIITEASLLGDPGPVWNKSGKEAVADADIIFFSCFFLLSWREVVQKDCQACSLNKEDAMDHGRWKMIQAGWPRWWLLGRWMFLLAPAHPGSSGQRAVKWLLLLLYVLSSFFLFFLA